MTGIASYEISRVLETVQARSSSNSFATGGYLNFLTVTGFQPLEWFGIIIQPGTSRPRLTARRPHRRSTRSILSSKLSNELKEISAMDTATAGGETSKRPRESVQADAGICNVTRRSIMQSQLKFCSSVVPNMQARKQSRGRDWRLKPLRTP